MFTIIAMINSGKRTICVYKATRAIICRIGRVIKSHTLSRETNYRGQFVAAIVIQHSVVRPIGQLINLVSGPLV